MSSLLYFFIVLGLITFTGISPIYSSTTCSKILTNSSISLATSSKTLANGTIAYTIDWNGEDKNFQLPSIVNDLKKNREASLTAVILAGNTSYDGTYHNLAFHLGDHVIESISNEQKTPYYNETVKVQLDSGEVLSADMSFRTQTPLHRTTSGEVFPVKFKNGSTLLIIKPIGDYNEIGDFAVPVLEALGIKSNNTLVVADDISVPIGETQFQKGPVPYTGNNSIASMNRALTYRFIQDALKAIKADPVFGPHLSAAELSSFQNELIEKVNLRSGNGRHTSAADITNRFNKYLSQKMKSSVLPQNVKDLKSSFSPLLQVKGQTIKTLKTNRDLSEQEKTDLEAKLAEVEADLEPFNEEQKKLQSDMIQAEADLKALLEAMATEHFAFHFLSIGTTGPTDGTSLVDFVLSPFPENIFNDLFWAKTWSKVINYFNAD